MVFNPRWGVFTYPASNAQVYTLCRLLVVSKCALNRGAIKRTECPGHPRTLPLWFPSAGQSPFLRPVPFCHKWTAVDVDIIRKNPERQCPVRKSIAKQTYFPESPPITYGIRPTPTWLSTVWISKCCSISWDMLTVMWRWMYIITLQISRISEKSGAVCTGSRRLSVYTKK